MYNFASDLKNNKIILKCISLKIVIKLKNRMAEQWCEATGVCGHRF
jgi:hypothetical protein